MPRGIYERTIEHKENISKSLMGNKRTLGHKEAVEHKRKISETAKKSGVGKWMKNRKFTEETRRKMSESHKGEKSHFWKGGMNPINDTIRKGIEFSLWREAVFARDNWTCQKTGIKGSKLHPHHINNFADYPDLRLAIDNGITLSKKAHEEFHKIYGKKNNTKEQLEEFLEK